MLDWGWFLHRKNTIQGFKGGRKTRNSQKSLEQGEIQFRSQYEFKFRNQTARATNIGGHAMHWPLYCHCSLNQQLSISNRPGSRGSSPSPCVDYCSFKFTNYNSLFKWVLLTQNQSNYSRESQQTHITKWTNQNSKQIHVTSVNPRKRVNWFWCHFWLVEKMAQRL